MCPRRILNRRALLRCGAGALLLGSISRSRSAAGQDRAVPGCVVGEPTAEKVGQRVLQGGGNAIDAVVAAALAGVIAAPHHAGIGGYGASAVVAVDGGRKILALDANTVAPAAMKADLFQPVNGKVNGARNEVGWLAAGVPGILAGLELLLDRFGTRPLGELMLPAIQLCREGFAWPGALAATIKGGASQFGGDPGSRQLYFRNGQPLQAGVLFQNLELAELLGALAKANSVAAFYRGDIAQRIAEAFQTNGGLVTAADLGAYKARLVSPLTLTWGDQTIHTAPLTSGGLTVLQALQTLHALKWSQQPPGLARTHARLEALRLAWRDRLTLLGDPEHAEVPAAKLLSDDYARESAERIAVAVKAGRLLAHAVEPRDQDGTINLSAADRAGNFVALTLTHGNSFGARVTVPGLGLTLGHGMSRFDPVPDHPNAPGPGKRPLHNMAPTIVVRRGKLVLAIGGRGGRKIPNALFEALTQYVVLERSLAESIAAPRLHTEGSATLEVEARWPTDERDALQSLGYRIRTTGSATLSAVALEEGQLRTAMR